MTGRKSASKVRRKKRKAIVFVIEIAVLTVLVAALFLYKKLDLIQSTRLDSSKIKENQLDEKTREALSGYTTIALFGLDNREQGGYDRGNSDVIMLMSINNDTKDVKTVSVYRDTFFNVAGADEEAKYRKANAAYAYGGAEQAVTMLNRNLDLKVDNYVAFDFDAVAKAVDALGGVDIDISSKEELKWLNKYISHTNGILKTKAKKISSTGTHTLDGVQAVAYARIRYTAGGDYKRAERQRRVLSEMVKKAKANPLKLNEVVNKVFPDIRTDLERNQMFTMISAMIRYNMGESRGFPFERTTRTFSSVGSIVIPCDLETNVSRLHQMLYGNKDYQPSDTVKEYNDHIITHTGCNASSAESDSFNEADDFQ